MKKLMSIFAVLIVWGWWAGTSDAEAFGNYESYVLNNPDARDPFKPVNLTKTEKTVQKIVVVKKGDTLWGLFGSNWKVVAEANGISDPRKLRVGKKLVVPNGIAIAAEKFSKAKKEQAAPPSKKTSKMVVKRVAYKVSPGGIRYIPKGPDWVYPSRNPNRRSVKESVDLIVDLNGWPGEVAPLFVERIQNTPPDSWILISKKGIFDRDSGVEYDMLFMLSGIDKVKVGPIKAAWADDGHIEAAKVYKITLAEKSFEMVWPLTCTNFGPVLPKEIARPEVVSPAPAVEKPAPAAPLELKAKPPPVEHLEIPTPGPCFEVEHDPIVGIGGWGNNLARGMWAYGEYIPWLRQCYGPLSFGLGIYGTLEDGETKGSDYEWWGLGIGPQAGMKYTTFYLDDEGFKRIQQFELKLRLVWEYTHGENSQSEYKMHQNSWKLGTYVEDVLELNDRWRAIFTGEAWFNLDRDRESTWSGDSVSSRSFFGVAAYLQYKLNSDVEFRFGGGPFWQGWDNLWGLYGKFEVRLWKTIMLGPYANIFPFGGISSAYPGASAWDIATLGVFVRAEFNYLLNWRDEQGRAGGVTEVPEEERTFPRKFVD